MSLPSPLSRCQPSSISASITSSSLVDFLVPALYKSSAHAPRLSQNTRRSQKTGGSKPCNSLRVERYFYETLARASTCDTHRISRSQSLRNESTSPRRSLATSTFTRRQALRWHGDYPQPVEDSKPQSPGQQPGPGDGKHGGRGSWQTWRPTKRGFFDSHAREPTELSHRPQDFDDVDRLQDKVQNSVSEEDGWNSNKTWPMQLEDDANPVSGKKSNLPEQLKLLSTVRELEEKLAQAKQNLHTSLRPLRGSQPADAQKEDSDDEKTLTLDREDYKGLVDLYYYTHKNRYTPEAPDYSPTPTFLEDYSFKLSEDFAGPRAFSKYYEDEEGYESPLKELEQILKSKHLREISVMQRFVELLIDNNSSNRALWEVYQKLPSPGVAFLPKGIIRVFLQRMSTPFMKSGNLMLRYLSLIDDMQKAKLPITRSEWSSAIYLAGRSFGKVTQSDMAHAFRLWRQMEQEAGVKASYVTFNILFDIAVRAGKYVMADNILREMHSRGLRLNRLGRVSLMYYHGLRGDGDAIRKTYRDFVDAGEIVDTLVLNCVIASLMNAGEPAAAEQTYERMKDLQQRLVHKKRADGSDLIYRRYPRGGGVHIDRELASNSLGRVLLRSAKLKRFLPEHHKMLQDSMPLRPDHHTFRTMIAYHANVSGDLNRVTVLMNEMFETFDLSMRTIHFQLLFKGFALHGKFRDPDATWNPKRLELAWETCRSAIKNAQKAKAANQFDKHVPLLPTAKAAELVCSDSLAVEEPPKRKRLDLWTDFMLDLAAFPRERRKPIERVHTELFDGIDVKEVRMRNPFVSAPLEQPDLQQKYYPLGDSTLDHEEGEYTLPGPAETIHANESSRDKTNPNPVEGPGGLQDNQDEEWHDPDEVRATRGLVCWLLRAYARCTGSRERVERVWNSVRLLWHPKDEIERQSVLRVFRRCLKDCDLYSGHIL